MEYTVFDMEADSLNPTKIHCMSFNTIRDGVSIKKQSVTDYQSMRNILLSKRVLVGHNIIRWDVPNIERLLDIKVTAYLIDTLAISWYLYPNVPKHGLESWGEYFGVPKPVITDWINQDISDYVNRCEQDVRINTELFFKQLRYLNELYEYNKDAINSFLRYLMFKMECAREQEEVRWKLDIQKCKDTLEMFTKELTLKEEKLIDLMPENVKCRELNVPKKLLRKDGSVSKLGQKWFDILEELGFEESYQGSIQLEKSREKGNPNSHQQLKEWLYSLGWKPITFKYNKDKETGIVDKVPQISLPHGKGVCPSVKKLYSIEPLLENIEGFYVISHRMGVLRGFLRDVSEDGYLKAEIAGFTNTLRFKHTVLVNLPGYTGRGDWKDGEHIRGCLIAPEGYVLCGSDMSSLEDRTKQHYMYYFDPKYVESMIKPGFDPHLDLAEFAFDMTKGTMGLSSQAIEFYKNWDEDGSHTEEQLSIYNEIKAERHTFKTVNYAGLYGSGAATMSRGSGIPADRCTILIKAYWEKNWSVKKIAKALKSKTVNGQMWLFNPVSSFWYSLRYDKDKFSTLNQGTGVYCFDSWVREARLKGIKMCGQFHDEVITPTKKGEESQTRLILTQAIDIVNEKLKLNRALSIDIQFGDNYAQIH